MNEQLAIMANLESVLFIIGVFILVTVIILLYVMVIEYRAYLDEHWEARYSFTDFVRRERFYIYLFLGLVFIMLQYLWYLLV